MQGRDAFCQKGRKLKLQAFEFAIEIGEVGTARSMEGITEDHCMTSPLDYYYTSNGIESRTEREALDLTESPPESPPESPTESPRAPLEYGDAVALRDDPHPRPGLLRGPPDSATGIICGVGSGIHSGKHKVRAFAGAGFYDEKKLKHVRSAMKLETLEHAILQCVELANVPMRQIDGPGSLVAVSRIVAWPGSMSLKFSVPFAFFTIVFAV